MSDELLALIDDLTRIARERGGARIEVETKDLAVSVSVDAPAPVSGAPAGPAARPRRDEPRTERVHATTVGIFSTAKEWATGERITRGAVLGAIQSLGHIAEVTAPADGEIAEVLVAAGAPVEYGQPLFVITPHG